MFVGFDSSCRLVFEPGLHQAVDQVLVVARIDARVVGSGIVIPLVEVTRHRAHGFATLLQEIPQGLPCSFDAAELDVGGDCEDGIKTRGSSCAGDGFKRRFPGFGEILCRGQLPFGPGMVGVEFDGLAGTFDRGFEFAFRGLRPRPDRKGFWVVGIDRKRLVEMLVCFDKPAFVKQLLGVECAYQGQVRI